MGENNISEMNERLNIAVNRINGAYYLWGRRHGLQENRLTVLYALGDGRAHTQTQICREWLIPKTTVNTIVKKLQEEGIVTADGSEKNKILTLTPYGEQYVKSALGMLYSAETAAMEHILNKYGDVFISAQEEYAEVLEKNLNRV